MVCTHSIKAMNWSWEWMNEWWWNSINSDKLQCCSLSLSFLISTGSKLEEFYLSVNEQWSATLVKVKWLSRFPVKGFPWLLFHPAEKLGEKAQSTSNEWLLNRSAQPVLPTWGQTPSRVTAGPPVEQRARSQAALQSLHLGTQPAT